MTFTFVFITIDYRAISGFHFLVSKGISANQLSNEQDSLFVSYGSMLMEGTMATLVIIAVAAVIGVAIQQKKEGIK